jgi:PiT family inorganic phosphate transporter
MVGFLLLVGLAVAAFVGFNIGGSSTGVAFGPAVGSRTISKLGAAALFTGFAFLGGWTVGRNVIQTMGGEIVPSDYFTLIASIGVLFFVGLALLISNLFGVPASTSMTAVGSIAGLGIATGSLNWPVMGRIVAWWLIAPILAFWVCGVIGRYIYPHLEAWFALDSSIESVFTIDRSGRLPRPRAAPGVNRREAVSGVLVVVIGCYMAFSAGASNTANAVAPLVGSGRISVETGVVLAAAAIGVGAFTIARRTLDTVGNDLTDLPLLAALIVEVISASLITFLSAIGIPASLAVSATMCIVGLGWGRASRTTTLTDVATTAIEGESTPETSMGALAGNAGSTTGGTGSVPEIGEEENDELIASELFHPRATARVITLWILTPTISAIASYLLFRFIPLPGL